MHHFLLPYLFPWCNASSTMPTSCPEYGPVHCVRLNILHPKPFWVMDSWQFRIFSKVNFLGHSNGIGIYGFLGFSCGGEKERIKGAISIISFSVTGWFSRSNDRQTGGRKSHYERIGRNQSFPCLRLGFPNLVFWITRALKREMQIFKRLMVEMNKINQYLVIPLLTFPGGIDVFELVVESFGGFDFQRWIPENHPNYPC